MKFTSKKDIEAPLKDVYRELINFDQFERMAMRRGAEVERLDNHARPAVGMGWSTKFVYRNKLRKLRVDVVELTEDAVIMFNLESTSVGGSLRVELMSLAPRRTRISLVSEVIPRTLAARILVQSFRLAKGRIQRRLDDGMRGLAALIEGNLKAGRR